MLPGLTQEEYQNLVMSVGTHRHNRKLTPLGVAKLLNKAANHTALNDIAERLALKDETVLRDFLSLLTLPAEVQSLVSFGRERGTLPFSVAKNIVRLSTDSQRLTLSKAALEHRLTKEETEAVIQRCERGATDAEQALAEILKTRPIVDRQVLLLARLSADITSNFDRDEIRRIVRRRFAELIGGANVISISVGDDRIAVLLSDAGASSPKLEGHLSSNRLDSFVHDLIANEA